MDAKVKEFLDAAKAKERKIFEKNRDAHLISLGLIDEEGEVTREYNDTYGSGFDKWDNEKMKYYREVRQAVKVTDEEYAEILRYSKAKELPKEELNNGAEKLLGAFNVITLIIGIIAAMVMLFIAMETHENGFIYLIAGASILAVVLVSWATVKVLLNISNNLHNINNKLDTIRQTH